MYNEHKMAPDLDGLEVDVSVAVEAGHGGLQHAPGDGLGGLGLAHDHDGVARRLGLVQLDHLGHRVGVHLHLVQAQLLLYGALQLQAVPSS